MDLTLLSYVPKKSKAVILISSLYHGVSIDKTTEKISAYNTTKGGVHIVDKICAAYVPVSLSDGQWQYFML